MLTQWTDRTTVIANLLNPAFCGEIIRSAIKGYNSESKKDISFALIFIILPIVLHNRTLKSLPRSTRKKFYEWYEDSKELKINLSDRIKDMVPFTRETIQFLLYYNAISISDECRLIFKPYRKKNISHALWKDVSTYYDKAEFLGKWLAKSGNDNTIYATIGILP